MARKTEFGPSAHSPEFGPSAHSPAREWIEYSKTKYLHLIERPHSPTSPKRTIEPLWDCIRTCLETFKRHPRSTEDKRYGFSTLQTMICSGAPIPDIMQHTNQPQNPSPGQPRFLIYVAPANGETQASSGGPSKQGEIIRTSGACMMTLGEILAVCIEDNDKNNPHKNGYKDRAPAKYTHCDPKTMNLVRSDFQRLIEKFHALGQELAS
ncbi:MAG: hypothetical protein ACKO43_01860 [Alphaproteobacteria bacterium]